MGKRSRKKRPINTSSESIFGALRILAQAREPVGIVDFHQALAEPASSVHRALSTLEQARFAARYAASTKYIPGPMCFHLVRALINRFPLRQAAAPTLRTLVELTESPVTLNVRLGWFSLRVSFADGRMDYFQSRRVGEVRLLHEGIAPVAMLAALGDEQRRAYRSFVARHYPSRQKEAAQPILAKTLSQTAELGYSMGSDLETSESFWVAFALRDATGSPIASIAAVQHAPTAPAKFADALVLRQIDGRIAELQAQLLARPDLTLSPFAHLDPDQIRFAMK
jgi:IclR family acetate operon transcriptional repressor